MTLPGIALFLFIAQIPGPQQSAAPASIEGIAIKVGTSEPLSRVTVKLVPLPASAPATGPSLIAPLPIDPRAVALISGARGSNQQTVTTGSDGKFLFENLKSGSYQMTATSPGYAPTEYGQRGSNGHGLNITVKAGQKIQNVTLGLTPSGTIAGRVVDSSGDPAIRALVQAQRLEYQEKGRTLTTVQSVTTDDNGEYRLFWLPPGKYYISVMPSDDRERTIEVRTGASNPTPDPADSLRVLLLAAQRDRRSPPAGSMPGVKIVSSTRANGEIVEEATTPVFYPDALDIDNAVPLEVRAGEAIRRIDMMTRTTRVYRIRGTIINSATGQPATAGVVTLLSRNSTTVPLPVSVLQSSEGAGGFEIAGVLPGSYYVGVTGSSPFAVQTPGKGISTVDVRAANVNDVIVTISTGTTITGRVVTEGVVPVPGPATGGRSSQSLVTLDPETPGLPAINGLILPDGTFSISGVMPADYRLYVNSPPGFIPKSILYSGKDVQAEGFHIGNVADGPLEIVLTNKAGRLEGNVLADRDQRIANATVVLVPTSSSLRRQTSLYKNVQSNADGHFTIESISPGSYQLFAWNDVPDRAWFDASFIRDFASQAKEIVIRENIAEMLDIQVIP